MHNFVRCEKKFFSSTAFLTFWHKFSTRKSEISFTLKSYCMKKNLSLKLMSVLSVLILMTSCVSKRKYTDAQNTITQLQTENAQLKEQGTSMQTNISSLEANNKSLQSRLD